MGRVILVQGDLLESKCNVIGHQANCKRMMGAGIARAIAHKYPKALEADIAVKVPANLKLGTYSMAIQDGKVIINLYGQFNPGGPDNEPEWVNREEAFAKALDDVVSYLTLMWPQIQVESRIEGPIKFGLPYMIGCGIAGGNWSRYMKIIEDIAQSSDIDIYLYRIQ